MICRVIFIQLIRQVDGGDNFENIIQRSGKKRWLVRCHNSECIFECQLADICFHRRRCGQTLVLTFQNLHEQLAVNNVLFFIFNGLSKGLNIDWIFEKRPQCGHFVDIGDIPAGKDGNALVVYFLYSDETVFF